MRTVMPYFKTGAKPLSCLGCHDTSDATIGHTVAPRVMDPVKDESVFACSSCFTSLTKKQEDRLWDWAAIRCECGQVTYLDDEEIILSVLPSSAPMLVKEEVRREVFFHATTAPNWLEAVTTNEVYVHVGSRDSAMERIASRDASKRKYLWEVAIKPEAVITEEILRDDSNWPHLITDCTRKHLGGDVQRYLNKYESAGSISLLIDPRMIEVVRVMDITEEDCEPYRFNTNVKTLVGA